MSIAKKSEFTKKINITLPSGEVKTFNSPINGFEISSSISKSLAKRALAIKIDGIVCDLGTYIDTDKSVVVLTSDDLEGLEVLRHSAAHLLAMAVKELHPEVTLAIGPTIENGFYYDFGNVKNSFSINDFDVIEAKMREISEKDIPFKRIDMQRDEAMSFFESIGERYKQKIIKDIPIDAEITVYDNSYNQDNGNHVDFCDLCKGPHVPSTKYIKVFKLTKVSAAYWRGDSTNVTQDGMLQRIYGTAWGTEAELQKYIKMMNEASMRDHKKIGKQMNLFHFQEDAPGTVFWHPAGWLLFSALVGYLRQKQTNAEYKEINTPEVMDKSLWEISGHWEKFRDNMFIAQAPDDDRTYVIKTMNCPGCLQIFKRNIVSYKDLPMKLSEFGKVYRAESSGALHGLMRVRGFTQDDAHIFCTEEQLITEAQSVCKFVLDVYADCGFTDVVIKFADRPDKRIGDDGIWDKAEAALLAAAKASNLKYTMNHGEGAFYGPKLEFVLKDALGRDWQVGTLQIDFNLPERFDIHYINDDGDKCRPVMLHRAIFGSLERFIGITLEHYAGRLPTWIAPTQLMIIPVGKYNEHDTDLKKSDDIFAYAKKIHNEALRMKCRSKLDFSDKSLSYKLRHHMLTKVSIIAVVGQKELDKNIVNVRRLGSDEQIVLGIDDFYKLLAEEIVIPV